MVRYGILGFGHHAIKRLVPGFAAAQHSRLQGLWRRSAEKAKDNAQRFGIPSVYATAEDLCCSSEIDAVFITSPDALHLPHVLLALQAGKPVLCEKPLGMNVREVQRMLDAAHAKRALFGVAQNFRYDCSVRLIRDWIEQDLIGQPKLAHAQFAYPAARSPRAWIYDPALACGGPIGDVGIHCIDALRFVLNDDITGVATLALQDAQSGAVESSAVIALEFTRGAIASVGVTTRAAYRSLIEITGETGVISSENGFTVDHPVEVILRREGKVVEQQTISNADGYTRMIDAFSAALQGGPSFAATGEDALHNQQALDAAYASWRSGRREATRPS